MSNQSLAVRTPAQLIELAVEKGANADELGKLMELQLRWAANEARLSYIASMKQFKDKAPEILKTRKVEYQNKDRSMTTYHHAELDKISDVIGEALLAVGITHAWRTAADSNGRIVVTCVLTHQHGHSEDVATLSGPADTSGGKNNIQAIGSTTTYLQRYTLLAGTGLAPEGVTTDNDGATDGLEENAVRDYLITMEDARETEELQKAFAAAYTAAKRINDKVSMTRFIESKNARKKELING